MDRALQRRLHDHLPRTTRARMTDPDTAGAPRSARARFGRTRWRGWLISGVLAWLLPFPGPHVERYIPLARVVAEAHADVDTAFWVVVGLVWAGGTCAIRLTWAVLVKWARAI